MNREDIIRMALEAGLAFDSEEYPEIWQTYMYVGREEIERFASLVASAAQAKEREACAKWLEDVVDAPNWAEAIRARGQA